MRYVLFGTAIDYNFVNFTKLHVSPTKPTAFYTVNRWMVETFRHRDLGNQVHNYMF